MKPPNIVVLTPNGRFQVGKKICLSISAHHPEHWQPAWGIRLILEALISFFPTEGKGAIGSLDWTPEERKQLAKKSHEWRCPLCENPVVDLIPVLEGGPSTEVDEQLREQMKQLHLHAVPGSGPASSNSASENETAPEATEIGQEDADSSASASPSITAAAPVSPSLHAQSAARAPTPSAAVHVPPPTSHAPAAVAVPPLAWSDPLVCAAIALSAVIFVLLLRKLA
jgi:ubiquitin-conjugating enzyme E2 J1